jgi:hypothetical protein
MRFYTKQHRYYCGIDLQARSMYVCILDAQGEILFYRNMPCAPELFLKAVAPYREDMAVAVESKHGKPKLYPSSLTNWEGHSITCSNANRPSTSTNSSVLKAGKDR